MKHKLFVIVISLALIVTMVLPGTLAIAADQDNSTGEAAPAVETPVTEENPVGNPDTALVIAPAECSCRTETEIHAENCPLYVTPVSDDTQAECTCDPKPAEGEAHKKDCPLHVARVAEPSLFERLMACKTLEELFIIVDETPQEALLALTEEENAQIEAKIAQMEPEPLPPVAIEETSDVPVVSEIIFPTVNFDNVAPFGAPVEG